MHTPPLPLLLMRWVPGPGVTWLQHGDSPLRVALSPATDGQVLQGPSHVFELADGRRMLATVAGGEAALAEARSWCESERWPEAEAADARLGALLAEAALVAAALLGR